MLRNLGYIKKNLSILKNIYDKLGKKNLHSLIVYSNSTIDNCISIKFFFQINSIYTTSVYIIDFIIQDVFILVTLHSIQK